MSATLQQTNEILPPIHRESKSKLIWLIAWPIIALETLQVTNQLLDVFFVGHLPTPVLTAAGAALIVSILIFAGGLCFNGAAVALVSRAFGSGDNKDLRTAARQLVSASVITGFALLILGLVFNSTLAKVLLPADNYEAFDNMVRYCAYLFIGMPGCFLMQSIAGSFIGIEDTKSPMFMSGLQILLHIVLNYLLIMPPMEILGAQIPCLNMGIDGAGLAYAISMWVSAFAYLIWIRKKMFQGVQGSYMPDWSWFKRIYHIAGPASITWVVRIVSYAMITKILSNLSNGSDAIAAVRAAFAIENITFVPAIGLGVAASTLVGQNLGMKNPKRAEELAWTAAHYAGLITAIAGVVVFLGADWIAQSILHEKESVSQIVATYLRFICVTEFFFGYALVLFFGMQGAGDTIRPFWISAIWFSLLRLPLAWFFAYTMDLGADGCWLAMTISQLTQGVASIVVFRQGKWKLTRV